MDAVFALVIWRLFTFLPTQPAGVNKWSSISKMLTAEWMVFILVLLAVIMVVFYWLKNNSLLGNQKKHNGIHTTRSIFPKTGAESKVTLA